MSKAPHLLIVLASTLVFASFAGCISEDTPEHDHADHAHGDDAGADAGNNTTDDTTTEPGNADNATGNTTGSAPTASLAANVTEAVAPATIALTLEGSEPDGDGLSWTLDWDGDGSVDEEGAESPRTINVTFDEAGNYTAILVVTDKDGSANATVDLVITAPDLGDGMCHRPDAAAYGPLWVDNRNLAPPDYSVWVYLESNGVDGLQVGGADEEDQYKDCENPDTLIF